MKERLKIYVSTGALLLLSYFPVGIVSSELADAIGDIFAPKQEHVVFAVPCMLAGWGFTGALMIGMILRKPVAFRVAALAFLGDMVVLIQTQLGAGDYQSWSDRAAGLCVAGFCLAAAIYVWRFALKPLRITSPKDSHATQ